MAQDYRLGPRIGRGGMADVFLAVKVGTAGFVRLVVVKRVRADSTGRGDLAQYVIDEARVLGRLMHPNLVQVHEVGRDAGGPWVVVEYLPGETLLTILRELKAIGHRLPWPVACRIGADLAAGLAAAHGAVGVEGDPAPILHRDLTPSNVIACYSGEVKLIDFGIAKAGEGDTLVGMVKGKLSYLAPELLRGGAAEPRTDLFQLGVVLHEAVSGRRLFEGKNDAARVHAVLGREIPRLRQVAGDVPVALERLVESLLARDPAGRPVAADQVRRELEHVLRAGGEWVTSHQLGDWLRSALPRRHADRLRLERACLAMAGEQAAIREEPSTLTDEPDTVVMPQPRRRTVRWPAVALTAALAVLAAAIGGSAAAMRGGGVPPEVSSSARWQATPTPIVRPLFDPDPDPDSHPETGTDSHPETETASQRESEGVADGGQR